MTVTQPAADRWGRWVSVLVPVTDPLTAKTVAVLAMDYPAAQWYNLAVYQTAEAGIVVMSCFSWFWPYLASRPE